jgi:RNA polymerase sigma factor (sigma-70 family)
VSTEAVSIEHLLREASPRVLAAVVRRYGSFETCEDAVQEALLAASAQWPRDGVPANPEGWLINVASRRWIEQWRRDSARNRREVAAAALDATAPETVSDIDDTLILLLLCCHPALTPPSQVALTLRAVGGLTTAEIARAFLVPEATVAQRISRAKQRIKASAAEFELPPPDALPERLDSGLHVLYLIFNEGYTASEGPQLHRVDLTAEAIRLTRQLHAALPDNGEVAGLLALMLLTEARRPARPDAQGNQVPLAEQDRTLWDKSLIDQGVELITGALSSAPLGPYQLQAAIAAVHADAPSAEATDWPQILGLYNLLQQASPGAMVDLGRAVAMAMVMGPRAGLCELAVAERDPALARHYRLNAVRAHLLELAGEPEAARTEYLTAAERTTSIPEQRYLASRAARLGVPKPHEH